MIEVWADGSCIGNPGPGGYAALVISGTSCSELAGSDPDTTNNRMELTAVIRGIAAADRSRPVTVYSDSTYALLSEKIARTRKPNSVNRDLWLELIDVTNKRSAPITWTKVKGHSGILGNERQTNSQMLPPGKPNGWNSMWRRLMARLLKETKIKQRFTEHDPRAKCASDAASLGRDQQHLGHADSKITERVYPRKPEIVRPLR